MYRMLNSTFDTFGSNLSDDSYKLISQLVSNNCVHDAIPGTIFRHIPLQMTGLYAESSGWTSSELGKAPENMAI
jgi:hypothetical protein